MPIDFNGDDLVVTLDSGVTQVDVRDDLYTAWKDWLLSNSRNMRFPPLFRPVGGDKLNDLLNAGSYFFLNNSAGWRIKPPEEDITVYLTGNIAVENPSLPALIPTVGGYTAAILGLQPVTQGFSPALGRGLEYNLFGNCVTVDVVNGVDGTGYTPDGEVIGTSKNPSKNINDAVTIANNNGLKKIHLLESMTGVNALGSDGPVNVVDFTITGESSVNTHLEILEAASCEGVTIKECDVSGNLDGGTHLVNCNVGDLDFMNGYIRECGLYGTIILGGNTECVLKDCNIIDQDRPPVIDMNWSGQDLAMPNFSGLINIRNLSSATEEIGVGLTSGAVFLESSITDGTIIISGTGLLYDYSNLTYPNKVNVAGLVNRIAEEYNGRVIFDAGSSYSGTTYPVGTFEEPVNNLADMLAIIDRYSLERVHLHSDITLTTGTNISQKIVEAHKSRSLRVTIESGVETTDAEFRYVQVTGTGGCDVMYDNCLIDGLSDMCGSFENCYFDGNNSCVDNVDNHVRILNSRAWDRVGTTIDCGQAMVTIQGWVSHLIVAGKYGTNQVNINSLMSKITVLDTCTEGVINLSGTGYPFDNSNAGCTVLTDKLNNKDLQTEAVWADTNAFVNGTKGASLNMLNYLEKKVYINTELVPVGDGSQASPFNDLSTAIDYAEADNIRTLVVYADIIIDRQLKNFKVEGVGAPTVDTNGQDLTGSEFSHCSLEGSYTGRVIARACALLDNFYLNGFFENCGLGGDLFCIDGAQILIKDCASLIPGLGRPTISMNSGGVSYLSIRGYRGGLTIKDCDNVNDTVTAGVAEGSLTFDNSCVLGEMQAYGDCYFEDNSNGANVTDKTAPTNHTLKVWGDSVETGYTTKQIMKAMSAVLAGKVSGAGTSTEVFRSVADDRDAVTSTVDSNGNRTNVVLDV